MKENSIEEDMKIVEQIKDILLHLKFHGWINDIKQDIDTDKVIRILEHILSAYKRVLKENEELLQEKVDNQKINLLAQNSMLDYQKGYEDGKANRGSAVQTIIDNQQYYIFQKKIEKYERHIEKLQKDNEELKDKYATFVKMSSEVIANSIPVQKVKDILNEINKEYIKQEEIFNKYFEKENRDMQDYYIQKEATNIMQELSWVEGKIQELLESEDK